MILVPASANRRVDDAPAMRPDQTTVDVPRADGDTLLPMRRAMLVLLAAVTACDVGTVRPADDGGVDASDGGTLPGFVPDRVTMGLDLPGTVPVLRLAINGQPIERDVEIAGTLTIHESPDATLANLGPATLTTAVGVQGRGNFTWSLPKKGYAFELQDGAGGDVARAFLGLPPGSDFALYACYTDKSCLRNALVYALGQELGRWSPRTRFVELFFDDRYQGLYMVWERIRRSPTRVDLPSPALDVTGGYIVRHEGGPEGDGSDFQTSAGVYYRFHYPDVADLTPAQADHVRAAWQTMETSVTADPAGAGAVIDLPSWIDRAIVEEVTHNWDGYVHSVYLTKERDADGGRIAMGPLWDFDLAFGNGNVTGYNCRTDVWAYQIQRGAPDDVPAYWRALWADAGFQHAWKCRYQALRTGPLALATFDARIAAWSSFTAAARGRDQARWPTIGTAIFPNCTTEPSYQAELTYLHDFIAARLTWLDGQAAAMAGDCP